MSISGVITANTCFDGGGVFVRAGASFHAQGGVIANNTATNDGGGIFTERYDHSATLPVTAYNNLSIASSVQFSGNRASRVSAPPTNPQELTHIQAAPRATSVGPAAWLLNNYDINYFLWRHIIPMAPWHQAYLIGVDDGTIRPRQAITRAEVATIFFRLICDEFRAELWSQENPFPDVRITDWYNNPISTLTSAGLFTGLPDGTFAPGQAITRAEFAAIAARFVDGVSGDENRFHDIGGHWAEGYINVLADLGWVQGHGDGSFRPNALMSRAEATALVNRMLDRELRNTDGLLSDGMIIWPDNTDPWTWYYLHMQEASHTTRYGRYANGHKYWTEVLPNIDWATLHRPDSHPDQFRPIRAAWLQMTGL